MRKGVTVARHLLDRVVAGDVSETAVLLVPRHGAAAAQVRVNLALVKIELVGVVIESDDHAGTGVGTAHWAAFASLLTYRQQLNRARDFREAQIPSAVLVRGM